MRLKTVKSKLDKPESTEGRAAKREYQNITVYACRPMGPSPKDRDIHRAICLACRSRGLPEPGHVVNRHYNKTPRKGRMLYGVHVANCDLPDTLAVALQQEDQDDASAT